MQDYFIVRWRSNTPRWRGDTEVGAWNITTMPRRPTLEEARKQLAQDVGYFYSDIEIQLVQITETVLEIHHGSNERA